MEQGVIERRRLMSSTTATETPPQPVFMVYPSEGNTLTISKSSRSTTGRHSTDVTVTNSSYSWWDAGLQTADLVSMAAYDTVFTTLNAQQNMVWGFVYVPDCVGAGVEVTVQYHLTDGTTRSEQLLGTTTTTDMVHPDVRNAFDNVLTGGTSPNYGHPYLEAYQNIDYITVIAVASKSGTRSPQASFNIYHSTNISIKAPAFTPGAGTYSGAQDVTIIPDATINGLRTYYKFSSSPSDPSQSDILSTGETGEAGINETTYLNAKSFLTLSDGTTISSPTTSGLYTITNSGTGLNPPVFIPAPGLYTYSPVQIEITNQNSLGTVYYTTDGSTPTSQSTTYTNPFYISNTTTVRAIAYNSSTGVYSRETSGTYTIDTQYGTNDVEIQYNSDDMSSCGLFQLAKTSSSGDPSSSYGFSITGLNKSTEIYFTIDGSTPTTSSTHLSNGEFWALALPNTLYVRWLATAPNCPDLVGDFWIRVNKAVARFVYVGRPFILGTTAYNWYSPTTGGYSPSNAVYVYRNGSQVNPAELTIASTTFAGNTVGLILYTPASGTPMDARFDFTYAWSAPADGDGYQYCPLCLTKNIDGTVSDIYSGLRTNMFNNRTGADTIYVSVNEISTLRVSGQLDMGTLSFSGTNDPLVQPCTQKQVLDNNCISYTNLEHVDLTPCTSMFQVADRALSLTFHNAADQTGLVSVQMPYRVSTLGNEIFARMSSQTRRPLTAEFYPALVPSATYQTFTDYTTASGNPVLIGGDSRIMVNNAPYGADVCDYEDAWKYHAPRSGSSTKGNNHTNMTIVDQDGWECGYVPGSIPTVATGTAGTPTQNSVTISGNNVTSDGGQSVTSRGVCFGTTPNPLGNAVYPSSPTGTGIFLVTKSDLQPGTTYYYRAFAANAHGTAFGESKSFTTPQAVTLPTILTGNYGNVSENGFSISGCRVAENGGAPITEFGTCVSTTNPPTYSNHQTGSGTPMNFGNTWTNLQPNTTYYYCAYAINSAGTAYGAVRTVQTMASGVVYPEIHMTRVGMYGGTSANLAEAECYLASCGSFAPVFIKYLCSTNPTPTIDNSMVFPDPNGKTTPGVYYNTLNDLTPNTTYYARVMAAQSQNDTWVYSPEIISFNSSEPSGEFNTGSATEITQTTARLSASGTVSSSAPYYGIVWSKSPAIPTIESNDGLRVGNSTGSVSISIIADNLQSGSTYRFRSFVCANYGTGTPTSVTYGRLVQFDTTTAVFTDVIHVKSGSTYSNGNYRWCAPVNLSFIRFTHSSLANGVHDIFSWGYLADNGIVGNIEGDPILSKPWQYIGTDSNTNVPTFPVGATVTRGNTDEVDSHVRDLFAWGATSQPHRTLYDAWFGGVNTAAYYAYGVAAASLTGSYGDSNKGEANWGFQNYRRAFGDLSVLNTFSPGTIEYFNNYVYNDWNMDPSAVDHGVANQDRSRTLTSAEMDYVLFTRATTSGKRFCKARIDHGSGNNPRYTNGLVIFKENWNNPATINQPNTTTASYTSNTIAESVWNSTFDDKAVFLPAAGYAIPTGTGISGGAFNSHGYYWLNNTYNANNAYCLSFSDSHCGITTVDKKTRCSVRLWRHAS